MCEINLILQKHTDKIPCFVLCRRFTDKGRRIYPHIFNDAVSPEPLCESKQKFSSLSNLAGCNASVLTSSTKLGTSLATA